MAVLVFLIILQITDFFFTLHGVNAAGVDKYEANPLLIFYMHRFGVVETLLVAKMIAIFLGYFLYRRKMFSMIWLLIGFYLYNFFVQIEAFLRYRG